MVEENDFGGLRLTCYNNKIDIKHDRGWRPLPCKRHPRRRRIYGLLSIVMKMHWRWQEEFRAAAGSAVCEKAISEKSERWQHTL